MENEFLWLVVIGSAAATFLWRVLGVVVVRRIDAEGAVFQWVVCISYAMVAALIFRMIFMPESELASVSLPIRTASVAIAFAAYYLFKRRLIAGVLAGGFSLSMMVNWLG